MTNPGTATCTYRGFLFDVGQVLVTLGIEEAMDELLARTHADRATVAAYIFADRATHALEEGRLTSRAYFADLQHTLGFDGTFDHFVTLWNTWVSERQEMAQLVKDLSTRYPVGIISNTNHLHFRHLMSICSFVPHVHRCVTSAMVGARKPAPAIYDVAIQRMDIPAQALIYVDDRSDCIDGGRARGLEAIHFTGYTQLVQALRQRGVVVHG
jgi:glucose-1-phosphatase